MPLPITPWVLTGVHERIGVRLQQIAFNNLDHVVGHHGNENLACLSLGDGFKPRVTVCAWF
jgi:hypothetical protein